MVRPSRHGRRGRGRKAAPVRPVAEESESPGSELSGAGLEQEAKVVIVRIKDLPDGDRRNDMDKLITTQLAEYVSGKVQKGDETARAYVKGIVEDSPFNIYHLKKHPKFRRAPYNRCFELSQKEYERIWRGTEAAHQERMGGKTDDFKFKSKKSFYHYVTESLFTKTCPLPGKADRDMIEREVNEIMRRGGDVDREQKERIRKMLHTPVYRAWFDREISNKKNSYKKRHQAGGSSKSPRSPGAPKLPRSGRRRTGGNCDSSDQNSSSASRDSSISYSSRSESRDSSDSESRSSSRGRGQDFPHQRSKPRKKQSMPRQGETKPQRICPLVLGTSCASGSRDSVAKPPPGVSCTDQVCSMLPSADCTLHCAVFYIQDPLGVPGARIESFPPAVAEGYRAPSSATYPDQRPAAKALLPPELQAATRPGKYEQPAFGQPATQPGGQQFQQPVCTVRHPADPQSFQVFSAPFDAQQAAFQAQPFTGHQTGQALQLPPAPLMGFASPGCQEPFRRPPDALDMRFLPGDVTAEGAISSAMTSSGSQLTRPLWDYPDGSEPCFASGDSLLYPATPGRDFDKLFKLMDASVDVPSVVPITAPPTTTLPQRSLPPASQQPGQEPGAAQDFAQPPFSRNLDLPGHDIISRVIQGAGSFHTGSVYKPLAGGPHGGASEAASPPLGYQHVPRPHLWSLDVPSTEAPMLDNSELLDSLQIGPYVNMAGLSNGGSVGNAGPPGGDADNMDASVAAFRGEGHEGHGYPAFL